ncbi:RNA-directed DNA polymerase from mobile element jockey-like Protein [Tribolium castaneum]|uniref:RNA-directed DNA polymerase from mobile element jockey-like Protein n=1 Tax=Tribolium castaneum TaxID=7070 RepID=D2CG20_TRICA|nr:RNA-directed DNA polymerase from mobile element jockey-like Protein [Tribolium castaneum]
MKATFVSNPLDVFKTRIQLQGELKLRGQHEIHYKHALHAAYVIIKQERIFALQKGLGTVLDDNTYSALQRGRIKTPILFTLNIYKFNFEGVFPDMFKKSKIIPVPKKNCVNNPDNYRPIALKATLGKLFEKLVKKPLVNYFEKFSLFHSSQHGFRTKHSTSEVVRKIVDYTTEALDNGHLAAITLGDLSKAFDCLNHDCLLDKLEHYGIRGLSLSFFKFYLSNRPLCVLLNHELSSFKESARGVPQGSVLGPVLLIIYVNDMFYNMGLSGLLMYANDASITNISTNIENLKDLTKVSLNKAEIGTMATVYR